MMMKSKHLLIYLLILVLLVSGCTSDPAGTIIETKAPLPETTAPQPQTSPYDDLSEGVDALEVDKAYLDTALKSLTTEEMAGRLPGTPGNQAATTYLQEQMKALGLLAPDFAPDYLHAFDMTSPIKYSATSLEQVDAKGNVVKAYTFSSDFVEINYSSDMGKKGDVTGKVFVVDDVFKLKEIPEGSVVVIPEEMPAQEITRAIVNNKLLPKAVLITSTRQNSGEFLVPVYLMGQTEETVDLGPLYYYVTPQVSEELVALSEAQDVFVRAKTDIVLKDITANNVVGYLPGTRDEGFIITAHFDHLGDNFDGTVVEGALDNASGTAGMMALAQALSQVENRDKTLYFVGFNGEEEGLIGSKVLAESGVFDPEKYTIINLDMIGASEHLPIEISATSDKSNDLVKAIKAAYEDQGFETIISHLGASDHFSFEQEGFAGLLIIEFDRRYYHTINDTYEKAIDIDRLHSIVNVVYKWLVENVD